MTDDERLRLAADATYLAGSIAAAVSDASLMRDDGELRRFAHEVLTPMVERVV